MKDFNTESWNATNTSSRILFSSAKIRISGPSLLTLEIKSKFISHKVSDIIVFVWSQYDDANIEQ